MKKLAIPGAALVALIALAGCGSSKSSSTASSSASAYARAAAGTASTAASTTTAAGPGETILTKHSKLGTMLAAGPNKLTVYLFEADKGGRSACSGACAKAWPPVTTSGKPQASGSAVSAELGTITRSDGTKQVTYDGHPLYFFVKDGDAGDAYGEGSKAFGADWYVVAPSGAKIDSDEGHSPSGS